jgi:putative flavoprotein involved in K+ transport
MHTIVIGGGQAGLSVSHELSARGVEHVVLERNRIAQSWRERWDNFRLVWPNWSLDLPGRPYDGDQPDVFGGAEEVIGYLERYAESFAAPLREGVSVTALRAGTASGASEFTLDTTNGPMEANAVVVCTGAYPKPLRPAALGEVPGHVRVMEAREYRNPGALAEGSVLVIGSGQSGIQIVEDLHRAGREVYLSCGRAPWAPRVLGGEDIVFWLLRSGFLEQRLDELPSPMARLTANVQSVGSADGHDLDYRVLQSIGVPLLGRLSRTDGRRAYFADDLSDSVAFGDARWGDLCTFFRAHLPERGHRVPDLPVPPQFSYEPITELDLAGFSTIILAAGYRPDYSWIAAPVTDDLGFPLTDQGTSTVLPGLFFCGVHFLRKRKSALLPGVGEDAKIVAEKVEAWAAARTRQSAIA